MLGRYLLLLALCAVCAAALQPQRSPERAAGAPEVVLAAGDIAVCGSSGDEATAGILDNLAGTVLTLGDNAYENGTAQEFQDCYEPSWGRHKARTRPTAGNHEYNTPGATGYYGYFGAAAGDPAKGYYSFDLGAWHVIALNSNCSAIGGCGASSPQVQWLRADLQANPTRCTLAYWHHARFSSGSVHGNNSAMQPLWQALYDYGAEIVLSGHVHNYERFAPQTPAGVADPNGIVEFVVGTGGRGFYSFADPPKPNSLVRNADTFGVLKLTLDDDSYDWEFVGVEGSTFTDTGSAQCHSNDFDDDSVIDEVDNCIAVANTPQTNTDAAALPNGLLAPDDDATIVRSDGLGDACDSDDDSDGLLDDAEGGGPPCASASGPTNALEMDSDGDHLTDGWECTAGSDPADASSRYLGSGSTDSDGDRVIDLWEVRGYNADGGSTDSDGDGCGDLVETASIDGDESTDDSDRLAVARRALGVWPADVEQDYVLDIDKNGAVGDPDRLFVSRAALLPLWLPKSCS